MSGFKDECGVFGIFGHPEAARLTYLGLYALQHRGQEAAGIVTSNESGFTSRKDQGYVADVFDASSLERLSGTSAIGHTRYSTSGESNNANIQPIYIECKYGDIAVCHNGNLVNAHVLRHELVERDPDAVARDVQSEFVSRQQAVARYGVVVDDAGHVQESDTAALRKAEQR